MKKLLVAAPVVLAAALSLTACSKPDTATNDATINEQVANDESPLDVNATGDNVVAPDDAALNNSAAPAIANAQ